MEIPMKHLEVFCKRQCNGHFGSPTPGSSHCIETTLRLSRGGSYADDPTLWPLQTVEDVSPVARQLIDIDTLHTLYLFCIKHHLSRSPLHRYQCYNPFQF